jgi:hypothetical protein
MRNGGRKIANNCFNDLKGAAVMSAKFELYCALREIEVPAEKARAVVDALTAARNEIAGGGITEHIPRFIPLRDKRLQQLRDELLELKFQHATDTIVMQVGGA